MLSVAQSPFVLPVTSVHRTTTNSAVQFGGVQKVKSFILNSGWALIPAVPILLGLSVFGYSIIENLHDKRAREGLAVKGAPAVNGDCYAPNATK